MLHMKFFSMLKSKDKYERAEGYCIVFLITGVSLLSLGIALSILNPKGIPAVTAMLGSLISFLATVGLIFVWLIKEFTGE